MPYRNLLHRDIWSPVFALSMLTLTPAVLSSGCAWAQNATAAPVPAPVASAPETPKVETPKPETPAKPAFDIKITNGDMEAGSTLPDRWDGKWEGRGTLTVSRDTEVKRGGKASLRVDTNGKDAMGSAGQFVDAPVTGAKITVSGYVKTKGSIKVNFAAQPFTTDWKAINFNQVGYAQNDAEWQPFSKEVILPDGVARVNICLLVEGTGTAWLDDVEITADTKGGKINAELAAPPARQDPTVPFKGYWADYPAAWLNYARSLKTGAHDAKPRIVFVGDSITQGWKDAGKAQWDKRFAPLGAYNAGIGGDKTSQILWRVEDGLLDGLSPELVVLAIGVNNLWNNEFGSGRVAEGVGACVKAIQAKCPKAKVLVIGVFPTQEDAKNAMRTTVKEVNTQAAKIVTGNGVRFVDFGAKFEQPDGSLSKDIMPDFLHMNDKGYAIYADQLEPLVKAMLTKK